MTPAAYGKGQDSNRREGGRCPDHFARVVKRREQDRGEIQRKNKEYRCCCVTRRVDGRLDDENRDDAPEHRKFVDPARKTVPGQGVDRDDHHHPGRRGGDRHKGALGEAGSQAEEERDHDRRRDSQPG